MNHAISKLFENFDRNFFEKILLASSFYIIVYKFRSGNNKSKMVLDDALELEIKCTFVWEFSCSFGILTRFFLNYSYVSSMS